LLSKHLQRREGARSGIGLYTYEQIKNVSPFQYFAQLLVGAFIACMGAFLLYYVIGARSDEIQKYGAAEGHFWGWLGGCAIVVIGIFMAHAGAIFYLRKIVHNLRSSKKQK
jgi:biotin transporter BioY